jgi:hypothetical protein
MERPHRATGHISYRDEEMHSPPDETGNSELGDSRVSVTSGQLVAKLMPKQGYWIA